MKILPTINKHMKILSITNKHVNILQITKQSLSRVLNQLVKEKYIILSIGEDKRTKNLSLTKNGYELENKLSKDLKPLKTEEGEDLGIEVSKSVIDKTPSVRITNPIFKGEGSPIPKEGGVFSNAETIHHKDNPS